MESSSDDEIWPSQVDCVIAQHDAEWILSVSILLTFKSKMYYFRSIYTVRAQMILTAQCLYRGNCTG